MAIHQGSMLQNRHRRLMLCGESESIQYMGGSLKSQETEKETDEIERNMISSSVCSVEARFKIPLLKTLL